MIKCVRNNTLTKEWKMNQKGLEKDPFEGNSTVWNHIVMVHMRGDMIQCRGSENGSKCIDQKDIQDANKLSYKQKLIVYMPLLLFDFFTLLCSLPSSQGI